MENPQHIRRDSVIGVVSRLIDNRSVAIPILEERALRTDYSLQQRDNARQQIAGEGEGILTHMKVAEELGVYEEVNSRIAIPARLKEEYWGPEHPDT